MDTTTSSRARRTRRHLFVLTAAFVLGGFAFAFGAPLFQAPDEPPHVDLIRHYARHPRDLAGPDLRVRSGVRQAVAQVGLPQGGPLHWDGALRARPAYPRFDEFPDSQADATDCHFVPVATCQNYHFVHPPSFYELLAPAARVLDRFSFPIEVLVLRLLCVVLVAPVVPLTYRAARAVWPGAARRPLAAATLVAFFPALLAVAAAVNNDSLMLLAAAATIAACAHLLRRPGTGAALVLGLATGVGLAVKAEFLALAVVAGLAVLAALPGLPRRAWLGCIEAFAVPVVLGSWWWVRNLVRFHGLTPPGGEILQPERSGPWNHASPLGYALHHGGDLLGRVWGLYGQTAVETPPGWRAGLSATAVGLVVVWLVLRRWRRPSAAGIRLSLLALFPAVLVAGALQASFAVYRRNNEVRGLLGRYVYAALPVLAIGAVAALAVLAVLARRLPSRLRLRPNVLLAVATVLAALGGLAGFTRAMHGFYETRSLPLVLARAGTVTAVPGVGRWLAGFGVGWVLCVLAAFVLAWRDRELSAARAEPAEAAEASASAPEGRR